MKLAAGAFLGGATSRLLPPSIPFRYFGAAVAYHVIAWLALLAGADVFPRFAGGLGWPLAALHFVTLGVLVMTAIGASLQLLPVATRQPLRSTRWPALIWWIYTPGVAAVALGMGIGAPALLAAGTLVVVAGLVAYAVLLARNLIGAKGLPAVVAHGWIALASLVVVVATALSLAGAYLGAAALAWSIALSLHVAFAAYGFMGMLALGLAYILVPMFALSQAPEDRWALASAGLGAVALILGAAAALGWATAATRAAAIIIAGTAVALHLWLMRAALRTGLRRELGRSFKLVRVAWVLLLASLVAGLGVALDVPVDGAATLFVLLVIPGWLLTFLLGLLQRIVPFLAAMHAGGRGKRLPTPSSLVAERPLAIHFVCHLTALVLLVVAVAADSPRAAGAAAIIGAAGATAFAAFFVIALKRMGRAVAGDQAPAA